MLRLFILFFVLCSQFTNAAVTVGAGAGKLANAVSLQGRPLSGAAPTSGQVIEWNATTAQWEPNAGAAASSIDFTSATLVGALPAVNGGMTSPDQIVNCSFTATVGANALTVALKDAAGSDPSATSPCMVGFRNATLTTGTYSLVSATAATSVVAADTKTLGCTATVACTIAVYLINNAGTIEIGLINGAVLDEAIVNTSTAISAGTALQTLYSTTARANVAVRLIGRFVITIAASNHWSNAATSLSNTPLPPVVSDWFACTPTGTWITNTTYTAFCKRIGDTLFMNGKVTLAGAPTAGALTITLPNSYNIDTAKINVITLVSPIGWAKIVDQNTNNYRGDPIWVAATTFTIRYDTLNVTTIVTNTTVTDTAPITFGNLDWIEYHIELPIVGWTGFGP